MKNFKTLKSKYKNLTSKASDDETDKTKSSYQQMLKLRASYKWEKLSKCIRIKWGLCQHPDYCEELATSVHHIKSAHNHLELFFLETNLMPLCEIHHRKCDLQGFRADLKLAEYWENKIDDYYLNR